MRRVFNTNGFPLESGLELVSVSAIPLSCRIHLENLQAQVAENLTTLTSSVPTRVALVGVSRSLTGLSCPLDTCCDLWVKNHRSIRRLLRVGTQATALALGSDGVVPLLHYTVAPSSPTPRQWQVRLVRLYEYTWKNTSQRFRSRVS